MFENWISLLPLTHRYSSVFFTVFLPIPVSKTTRPWFLFLIPIKHIGMTWVFIGIPMCRFIPFVFYLPRSHERKQRGRAGVFKEHFQSVIAGNEAIPHLQRHGYLWVFSKNICLDSCILTPAQEHMGKYGC